MIIVVSKYIRDHWIDIAALAVAFVSFLFSEVTCGHLLTHIVKPHRII